MRSKITKNHQNYNLESCLADISSSYCPQPASGKTSVAGGISGNTAALGDKCDASTCTDIQEAIQQLQSKFNLGEAIKVNKSYPNRSYSSRL